MRKRIALVALAMSAVASARATLPQATTAERGQIWLGAARRHQPGEWDDAARAIAQWSRADLLGAASYVRDLMTGGPSAFDDVLARAALLHADIAMLRRRDDGGYDLPSNGQVARMEHDGQVIGGRAGTVHWDVARVLLSEVRPKPSADERVRLWYRASTAYFQHWRDFAELEPNLRFGLELFPNDPVLLLYAGMMHESYAEPRIQNTVAPASVLRQVSPSGRNFQVNVDQRGSFGSVASELKDAEKFFREALAADPDLVEARIRLGHVLGLRDRPADAVRELQVARKGQLPAPLQYIVLIFLGREHVILGDREAARTEFQQAVSLYPGAQSPRLGLSQIARDAGGTPAALAALQILEIPPVTIRREDPLWQYERLHTTDAAAIVAQMRWRLGQ